MKVYTIDRVNEFLCVWNDTMGFAIQFYWIWGIYPIFLDHLGGDDSTYSAIDF